MTKAGQKANNWFTRSLYDTLSGEDWVLFADHEDPRKRQWVKYDRNGKVVNKKTGALNLGGNSTEYIKRGGPVKTALGIPRQSEKDFVKDQGGRLDEYKDQPKPEKPKKEKSYHLKHLDDARDERDKKWAEGLEGISDALSQDDEAESTLESVSKIVDAAATIKKINDNRQKEDEPTENENKENIATKSMEHYFNTDVDYGVKFTGSTDYDTFNTEKLLQLDFKDSKQKLVGHNWYVNKLNLDYSGEQTSYKQMRKTADERHKRRMEDALAKGSPLKQFELDKQRGVGTPVNELFKKPEDVNNVEENKQIETEVKNEDKKIENTDKIIDEGAKLTDSVDNIDGKIGDFVDPDDWKNKNLLGNMA